MGFDLDLNFQFINEKLYLTPLLLNILLIKEYTRLYLKWLYTPTMDESEEMFGDKHALINQDGEYTTQPTTVKFTNPAKILLTIQYFLIPI